MCDFACNVESCGFDLGDCLPVLTEEDSTSAKSSKSSHSDYDDYDMNDVYDDLIPLSALVDSLDKNNEKCADNCNTEWLGDNVSAVTTE